MGERRRLAVVMALLGLSLTGQAPSADVQGSPLSPPKPRLTDRKGIYVTAYAAGQPGTLAGSVDKLGHHGLDTVVVDVKNNHGEVCCASSAELAQRVGAVTPLLARRLGLPSAPWVPPTVEAAVAYNLAIAAEAERAGFDEIQFDYIRFPDDGPIGPDCSARRQAVKGFLARARAEPTVPLSVDVCGRVMFPWNARRIDPIGQCLEGMAQWVDAISLMLHPSHYPEREFKDDPYGTVRRGIEEGRTRIVTPLRPYLQAFEMGPRRHDPCRVYRGADRWGGGGGSERLPLLEPALRLHRPLGGAGVTNPPMTVSSTTCPLPPDHPRMRCNSKGGVGM